MTIASGEVEVIADLVEQIQSNGEGEIQNHMNFRDIGKKAGEKVTVETLLKGL